MKTRVLFLFGGNSVEHEISILSALQAMEHLDESRYEALACYISRQGDWYCDEKLKQLKTFQQLAEIPRRFVPVHAERRRGQTMLVPNGGFRRWQRPFDIVFPILHGPNGEDGSAAGFCQLQNLPYCESDVLCSALGQDKIMQKRVLAQAGFPLCRWIALTKEDEEDWERALDDLRFPLIIKPARLGSSIGIVKCKDKESCLQALPDAFAYGSQVVAEECVEELREFNCSLLHTPFGYRASAVEEVLHEGDLLDYQAKYMGQKGKGIQNTRRVWLKEEALAEQVQQQTVRFGKLFDVQGVARVDFLYDTAQERLYVNEINTIPGSLSCYLWEWSGVSFRELLDLIIQDGLRRYRRQRAQISHFDTNVLRQAKSAGIKK